MYQPSKKQAMKIANAIKSMLKELEKMGTKTLTEIVPEDEKDHMYVSIGQSNKSKELVDIRVYNSATKSIAIKSYTMVNLLRECSDIFLVNTMIDSDMRNLYKLSKNKVFKKDTEVYI